MVISLYHMSLFYTSEKILQYLQKHMKICKLESRYPDAAQLCNEAPKHSNTEITKLCPIFMETRQFLQSNICQEILEDLLDILSKYRTKTKQKMVFHAALPLLFNEKMTKFVIKNTHDCFLQWHQTIWGGLALQPAFNLMLSYGTNITEFDVLSLEMIHCELFTKCLQVMKNLRYLSFSVNNSIANSANRYVYAVGQNCSQLVYLYVRYGNLNISGLQQLVFRDYPKNEVRNDCCSTIQYLSIFNSAIINFELVRMEMHDIVLTNFTNLRILRDEDVDVVSLVCRKRSKSFENFTRIYTMPVQGVIDMALLSELCPNVTGLSLIVSRSDVLPDLYRFKNLDTLDIHSYSVPLENYLKMYGVNLTTLYFHGHQLQTDTVDLLLIGTACPNLEKLVLRNIRYKLKVIRNPGTFFQKLKTLYLLYTSTTSNLFDVKILTWLRTTNVEEIYVKGCLSFFMPTPLLAYSKLKHFCIENIFSCVGFVCVNHLIENCQQLETLGSFDVSNPESAIKVRKLLQEQKNSHLQFLIENETFPYAAGHPSYFKVSERVLNNTSLYSYGKCSFLTNRSSTMITFPVNHH